MRSPVRLLTALCLPLCWTAPGPEYKEEVGRIVNGEEAKEGSLPYQASLQLNIGSRLVSTKPAHFCGGAFIAKDWIVTASHCVKGQSARGLKIVGGTNDITDEQSPTFAVSEVIMQDYNDVTKVNDIALLKLNTTTYDLERRTKEGHPTQPVSLCPETFQPQGRNCTVSGWGHLKSRGSSVPDKLREVSVVVLHTKICDKMLAGYPWDRQTNTMLCAGGEDKVRPGRGREITVILMFRTPVRGTLEVLWSVSRTVGRPAWPGWSAGGWAVPRREYPGCTPT